MKGQMLVGDLLDTDKLPHPYKMIFVEIQPAPKYSQSNTVQNLFLIKNNYL